MCQRAPRGRYGIVKDTHACGPVAQLGARFHGMEEVVSSNLTRSTKPFQRLTVAKNVSAGVQTPFCTCAALGTVSVLVPARDLADSFNKIAQMGTVGTVFALVVCWRRQHLLSL